MLRSYLRLLLFTFGLLVGVQVPGFITDYSQRLEAHRLEAEQSLKGFRATAQKFFKIVKDVFENWNEYKKIVKCNPEELCTTDWAYSIACHILGVENTTILPFYFARGFFEKTVNCSQFTALRGPKVPGKGCFRPRIPGFRPRAGPGPDGWS